MGTAAETESQIETMITDPTPSSGARPSDLGPKNVQIHRLQNPTRCLSKDLTKPVQNNRVINGDVTLTSSWRINFLFTNYVKNTATHRSIFRFTTFNVQNLHHRNPDLMLNPDNDFHVFSTPCTGHPLLYKNGLYWGRNYPNNIALNVEAAVSMEYIREINQFYFYVNGERINPNNVNTWGHPNPMTTCYGMVADFYLGDPNHAAANAGIRYFSYEDNVTGQPLGGLTRQEVLDSTCQGS